MQKSNLRYADLHFHTNFSDNRDSATLEQMVQTGARFGLTCFGTGDHNHNLTEEDWNDQQEETRTLQNKYPQYQLLNNCELTFRFGHALLLSPETITGTIKEAYFHLFSPSEAMLIINHPYISTDQWKGSILPHARGIEVINGSVYTHGEAKPFIDHMLKAYEQVRIIDFPHVTCYADYLDHGVFVLPFGASDAHSLAEMGIGVTGYRGNTLEEAIATHSLFAATDTGVCLSWRYDQQAGVIYWQVEMSPSDNMPEATQYPLKVEWYRGNELLLSTHEYEGRLPVSADGYYWFGAQRGTRLAVSAPTVIGSHQKPVGVYRYPLSLQHFLYKHRGLLTDTPPIRTSSATYDGYLYCSHLPEIIDSSGTQVNSEYTLLSHDIVIQKSGNPEQVYEFFTWLERNEIHEYKFGKINYQIDDSGCLDLKAVLLPLLSVPEGFNDKKVREAGEEIQSRLKEITSVKLFVEIAPLYTVRLHLDNSKRDIHYPLLVIDQGIGVTSWLGFTENSSTWYQQFFNTRRVTNEAATAE
ncbi:MAG: hypothetical protein ACQEQU_05035 [Spirochaetota bacterium]